MASTPSGLQIAVALFERGFEEVRIEEALQCCNTLDEAIAWLSSHHCSSAGGVAGGLRQGTAVGTISVAAPLATEAAFAAGPSAAFAAGPSVRRRTRRKVAASSAAAPLAPMRSLPVGPPAGASTADPGVAGAAPAADLASTVACTGLSPLPVATPSAWSDQDETRSKQAAHSDCSVPALPIEPRDANRWWRLAADRWREITASLRRQAMHGEVDVKWVQTSTVAALGAALHKRQRQEEDSGEKTAAAAPLARRPPATPCSAEQPQQQQHPPVLVNDQVLTPFSSPRAMRINSQAEACEICCNDISQWRAVRLGCGHGWYCTRCIQRHTEARLAVGAASVTCPECSVALAERDLRKLLPTELIDRLLARSLEQAISSAADLWACPTPNCPMRVALGDGELPRLRCNLCKKDSCLRCFAQPYHRGLTCDEHAERMRDKKGKRQQRDEDSLMRWIKETGTKQCPTCRIAVTKQNLKNQESQRSECHKMYCRNCGTRFCFKCLAVLTESYTCGCSIDAHGFVNPHTGRRLNHLRGGRAAARERPGR